MITLQQAKELRPGQMLHHSHLRNADGTPLRLWVNGVPKVWVRNPDRVRVPFKYGLRTHGYITNGTFEGGHITVDILDVDGPV